MIKVDETDPVGELEPSFPYRDVHIRRNTDVKEFYDLQTEIGRGKFGTVYRCRERTTGLSLAAKFVSVARKEDRRNVEREVDIMRSLQHPRLLQLYDAFEYEKNVCLILELIEGGELFERVIDDDFVLTEKACTIFMRQICEGIQFIHQQHILHLDLKPENILCLTKTGNRIKIIDFGLARRYEPGKKLQVLFGTPEFVAPEVVNFDPIGFNTDMWSIGVICYVLLSGLSPFMGDTDIETMANVTVVQYDFDDEVFNDISDDAKDFISKLLVKEKENRMCAEACLHHRWLRRKPAPPAAKATKAVAVAKAASPPPRPASAVPVVESADKPAEENNNSASEEDKNAAEKEAVVAVDNQLADGPPPIVNGTGLGGLEDERRKQQGQPEADEAETEVGKLAGAKDNLKSTVERWTEHPDSPYIFDTTAHTISPCPSLASVLPEDAREAEGAVDDASTLPLPYDRLLGSERRASDSNCFVRLKSHHLDVHDRINLADEIRKLSEKLFRMATWAPALAPRPTADGTEGASAEDGEASDEERRTDSRQHVVSPLVGGDEHVESTTVTETVQGRTTTKTTFKSTSTSTSTARRVSEASSSRLSDSFAARLSQTQIPTKRFWPIEPGRMARMSSRHELQDDDVSPVDEASSLSHRDGHRLSTCPRDAAQFHRMCRRSLSSASASSTTTTHSAPQSPRWSPDPELPPPPSSDLTKDLLLRLLHRLDSQPAGGSSNASQGASPHHHSLLGLGGMGQDLAGVTHWADDPFFRPRTNPLEKKRTLIASHDGGL